MVNSINNWTLQQCGATSHNSDNAQACLMENVPNFTDKYNWPGNSPDLLLLVNSKVYSGRYFRTIDEIKLKVEIVWKNIPIETLQNLLKNMKKRCKLVFKKPSFKL